MCHVKDNLQMPEEAMRRKIERNDVSVRFVVPLELSVRLDAAVAAERHDVPGASTSRSELCRRALYALLDRPRPDNA